MNTLRVTIGGKEVDLTPRGSTHHKPSAATPTSPEPGDRIVHRPIDKAAIVGLLAALGLLVILVAWLSKRRLKH